MAGGSDWMKPLCDPAPHQEDFEGCGEAFAGNKYYLMHGIGRGKYGMVYEGRNLATGEALAVKVMPRHQLVDPAKAEREWIVAAKLCHPNVIQLKDVQVSQSHIFIVMELASGGALFDTVSQNGRLALPAARRYFRQIVSGVQYCHSQGVAHRDLKLENLMAASDGSDVVKITDFGMSKDESMSACKTYCGTLAYMAPEVTDIGSASGSGGHRAYDGPAADIWSLGVILYVMLCCAYPFGYDGRQPGAEAAMKVLGRIRSGTFKNPGQLERCCPPDVVALVRGMLTVNPSQRISIEQVRSHAWLADDTDGSVLPTPSAPVASNFDGVSWGPDGGVGESFMLEQLPSVASSENAMMDDDIDDSIAYDDEDGPLGCVDGSIPIMSGGSSLGTMTNSMAGMSMVGNDEDSTQVASMCGPGLRSESESDRSLGFGESVP